ncbi:hypothetical protein P9112_002617 [Eukaryota sp. TZLM1-RC]
MMELNLLSIVLPYLCGKEAPILTFNIYSQLQSFPRNQNMKPFYNVSMEQEAETSNLSQLLFQMIGTIGTEGLDYLGDLANLLKVVVHLIFLIWKNRIVFSLLKALPRFINSILNNITEF